MRNFYKTLILLIILISSISCNDYDEYQEQDELSKSSKTLNTNSKSFNFNLNFILLKSKLKKSTDVNSKVRPNLIISFPDIDGKVEDYLIYENQVMSPELSAKYPEIKSYVGVNINNPSIKMYFSVSPLGLKSMTLKPNSPTTFIEPVTADLNSYKIFKRSKSDKFECNTDNTVNSIKATSKYRVSGADDGKFRTLRLAVACTAEYATLFGGTKILALAGINNTMTRVNGILETDLGLKLILVANNDELVFTDPLTDPYSDYSSKFNWRQENMNTLNSVVGITNYDIGHLFGAGPGNSGDAGGIGTVCSDFNKGSGYTVAYSKVYQGDAFDSEYVAHEMGHQLGAYHTFTYKSEAGTGAQMEPGDGSTIMSYGGLSMKAFQNNPDSYFHAISIQEITNNIRTKTCPTIIISGNSVPLVNAGLDYIIPKGTPFMLKGIATDVNSDDALTYSWEQMDLGDATTSIPNPINTTGPLFRSYPAVISPIRYLPNLTTILAGLTSTPGTFIISETLPGVNRNLNFRLTVRDNRVGVASNSSDDMKITVDGTAGPFIINSQNISEVYNSGTLQSVNWDVAGTNTNGINCTSVDILLSIDGGKTFPILLLTTPNNGSVNVIIPNISGTTNRIMVKGTNNIFFDINNSNFTIIGNNEIDTTPPSTPTLSSSGITISSVNLSWTPSIDDRGIVEYDLYQNNILKTTTSSTSITLSGLSSSSNYSFYIKAKDAAANTSISNSINVTTLTPLPPPVVLTYCTSRGGNSKEYINRVQIGTINNTSDKNNGYGDYTSLSTNITIGSVNNITITPLWIRSIFSENYNVWIDLNQDKDFNDAGELVWSSSKSKFRTIYGSFTIPNNALTGPTRMRVSMKNGSLSTPCEIFSNGEVEDYTVNIIR